MKFSHYFEQKLQELILNSFLFFIADNILTRLSICREVSYILIVYRDC